MIVLDIKIQEIRIFEKRTRKIWSSN